MNNKSPYYNVPLNKANLIAYIRAENPEVEDIKLLKSYVAPVVGFLQKNYGDSNDCTIVSIATLVYHELRYDKNRHNTTTFQEVYDVALGYAKKCLYTPKSGTLPIFNKTILKKTLKHFNLYNTVKTGYFKQFGFTFKNIENFVPMNLSIFSDGRGYYENHSVTVTGYMVFQVGDKKKTFLSVLDNWSSERRFVDYDKLSVISSINYIKK